MFGKGAFIMVCICSQLIITSEKALGPPFLKGGGPESKVNHIYMVVAIPESWGGAVSRSELRRPFWTPPSNGVNDATYMSNPSNSIVLDITRPHGGSVRSGGPPSRPGSDFRYRESNPVPVASKRRRSWKEPVGVEPTAGGVLSKRSTTRSGSSL